MRPNRLRELLRAEKPTLGILDIRHFCMSWNVEILFDCFKREGEIMRNMLEGR
jgi:hypothetical protein